jgi:hypothetical protein
MASSGKMEGPSAPAVRRDPYEVLSVPRDSSDQEIKSAYRKLALKSVPPFFPCSCSSCCAVLIYNEGERKNKMLLH